MEISYDIGYKGIVKFNNYNLLATDGNVSYTHQPIYSSGLWGASDYNATSKYALAPDVPQINASVGFQLTNSKDAFLEIGGSITQERFKTNRILIFPNGVAGYASQMYTKSLSFQVSQQSLVQCSMSFVAARMPENVILETALGTAVPNKFNSVFPYYSTVWELGAVKYRIKDSYEDKLFQENKILNWNFQINQQISFVKFCDLFNGDTINLMADYAIIGLQDVTGHIATFGQGENFSDYNKTPFDFISDSSKITMIDVSGNKFQIKLSNMLYTQDTLSLAGHSQIVKTEYNFQVAASPYKNGLLVEFA